MQYLMGSSMLPDQSVIARNTTAFKSFYGISPRSIKRGEAFKVNSCNIPMYISNVNKFALVMRINLHL